MEIIKYNLRDDSNDLPDTIIRTIAYIMFNKELNKRVFTREGNIDNPEADNDVILHEGVTYSISHSIGNLIYLIPDGVILKKSKIRVDITRVLEELYKQYEEKNTITIYNKNTSVFTSVATETPSVSITRYIGDTHKTTEKSTSNGYMFKWYDDRTCVCTNGNNCTPLINARYYDNYFIMHSNFSLNTNSIIIDLNDIFKTDEKLHHLPIATDFTMSQLMSTYDVITYEINRICHVDKMIRKLYNNNTYYKKMKLHNIFGICEEKWEAIKPLRLYMVQDNTDRINVIFNRILNINKSYEEEELEEKKDRKSGIEEHPNDRCHICYMLLYDTIYVLEFEYICDKHICICTLCLHVNYVKVQNQLELYITKSNSNYSILKITYPRTCYDLINRTNISPQYKKLLCDLAHNNVAIVNNIIQTQRHIGIRNIHSLLYKNIDIDYEGKMFFLYEF